MICCGFKGSVSVITVSVSGIEGSASGIKTTAQRHETAQAPRCTLPTVVALIPVQPTASTMFSLRSIVVAAIAVSAVLAAPTHTNVQRAVADDLNHQLVGEPTALGRFKLLNSSVNNFIFDFVAASRDASATPGPDGTVVLATAGNYPAAVGNGVAMGVGMLRIA